MSRQKSEREFERSEALVLTVILALVCLGMIGCRKKEAVTASPSEIAVLTNAAVSELATGPAAPPEPPQPPSPSVLARADDKTRQAVVGEVDAFLTGQLQIFVQQKNRLPASFSELARARLDSVPRPPAGKKWVIDTESIEVKAVVEQ